MKCVIRTTIIIIIIIIIIIVIIFITSFGDCTHLQHQETTLLQQRPLLVEVSA